jgi:hypothetical protein
MQFYVTLCVNTFLYAHIFTPYIAHCFVFATFPSVKTLVSRLEQTSGEVSNVEYDITWKLLTYTSR